MREHCSTATPLTAEDLERLFSERRTELRRVVSNLVANDLRPLVSADDLLQDVWIDLAADFPRRTFTHRAALTTWIDAVVRTTTIDRIRQARAEKRGLRRRDHARGTTLWSRLLAAPGRDPSPSGVLASAEARAETEGALQRLPARQRVAIRLRAIEGHSPRRIAVLMRNTVLSVKTHLKLARRHLREDLDHGPTDG